LVSDLLFYNKFDKIEIYFFNIKKDRKGVRGNGNKEKDNQKEEKMRRKKRKLRWRSKRANHRKKPTMG